MKKSSGFERFYSAKKGAAKKEQFRQDKRKWKKELQENAERKRAQQAEQADQKPRPKIIRKQSEELMPLNKYLAHSGVSSRRDAAEIKKRWPQ